MKNNTESGASEPADDVSGSSTSTEVRRPVSLADEDALDAFVADADAAVIEFYTDGCGICASMEPVLGNVARELDLAVATVNPGTTRRSSSGSTCGASRCSCCSSTASRSHAARRGSSPATISPRGSRTTSRSPTDCTPRRTVQPTLSDCGRNGNSRFRVAYNEAA